MNKLNLSPSFALLAQVRSIATYLSSVVEYSDLTKGKTVPIFRVTESRFITSVLGQLGFPSSIIQYRELAEAQAEKDLVTSTTCYLPSHGSEGYEHLKELIISNLFSKGQAKEAYQSITERLQRDYIDEAIWFSLAYGIEAANFHSFFDHAMYNNLLTSYVTAGKLPSEIAEIKKQKLNPYTPITSDFSQKGNFAVQFDFDDGNRILLIVDDRIETAADKPMLIDDIGQLELDQFKSLANGYALYVVSVNGIQSVGQDAVCTLHKYSNNKFVSVDILSPIGSIFVLYANVRKKLSISHEYSLIQQQQRA